MKVRHKPCGEILAVYADSEYVNRHRHRQRTFRAETGASDSRGNASRVPVLISGGAMRAGDELTFRCDRCDVRCQSSLSAIRTSIDKKLHQITLDATIVQ